MKIPDSSSGPTAPTDTQPGTAIRPGLVLMIGALSALTPLAISMYLPGLPSIVSDLGITTSLGQLTLTACLLGLAAGQVITGPLSDRLGRRRPLLVGLLAFALVSFCCALAPSAIALIALRFLQGLVGAAGVVIALATVRDLFAGADMARFLTLTSIVTGITPLLAPLAGGQVLRFTSWHGIFLLLAALGVVLALVSAFGMSETLPVERRTRRGIRATLGTFGRLLRERLFLGYALSSGLALGALFAYVSASPFVLQNIYGISPQLFSLMFGLNAVGGICVGQVGGRLVKRVQPQRLLAVGLGSAMCGGLLLLLSEAAALGLAGILPGFFLVTGSIGLIVPNATALAMQDHPHEAGSAAGLMGLIGNATGGLAAPLVGIAGPTTALPAAITIFVLSTGACCAFALLAARVGGSRSAAAAMPARSPHLAAARDVLDGATAHGMRAITISREYGSGGGEVAARLARRLGWQLIDHEIVARVAYALDISPEAAQAYDERAADQLPEFLAELQAILALPVAPMPIELPIAAPAYDQARRLVVQQAAAGGRVVIVGRGAQVLLAGRRDVLHARIIAPMEARIAYVMRREGLDAAAAQQRIESKERDRARFLMAAHGKDSADGHLYDIRVNTAVLSLDGVVDLLVRALEHKAGQLSTPGEKVGLGTVLTPYPRPTDD